jgi:hypothetical protein
VGIAAGACCESGQALITRVPCKTRSSFAVRHDPQHYDAQPSLLLYHVDQSKHEIGTLENRHRISSEGQIYFDNDLVSGTLWLALKGLPKKFDSELLQLTILDILASRYKLEEGLTSP